MTGVARHPTRVTGGDVVGSDSNQISPHLAIHVVGMWWRRWESW